MTLFATFSKNNHKIVNEVPKIITIKDIARKFKCSPSTVSRALNDNPIINEETRKTIQEYASRMGYQRNTLSLSLLNKSSKTIGIILPNINRFHESSMVDGLQSVLQPMGYLLNICVTNESYELEKEYIERLLANRVDGIFISVSQETFDNKHTLHLEKVIKRNIPLIFIDRKYDDFKTNGIIIDDYQGAFIATEHLIKIGCKRIAHLQGPKGLSVSESRLAGYKDCLIKYNLQIDESLILQTGFEVENAIEPTQKLLSLSNLPDGIFGVNDHVCIGAMHVIQEKGIQIPDQIALVGFDNTPITDYLTPSLTSVARQSREIGLEASKLFLGQIKNPEASQHSNIVLPPSLIIRKSSKK